LGNCVRHLPQQLRPNARVRNRQALRIPRHFQCPIQLTEAVDTTHQICLKVVEEFPKAIFFLGKLIFKEEKWYYRFLHNETPNAIQRRLQFDGLQAIVLPIRVLAS
ncbi:MAG TPA: hypothetical protein VF505_18455, partial [Thermoanaerobaculia bacterium]